MSDIHIRLIIFVVVMGFLTFSGIFMYVLAFFFETIRLNVEYFKKKTITNYYDFIEKWNAFMINKNRYEKDLEEITSLEYKNGDFKARIDITRDITGNNFSKREIVLIYIIRNGKFYASKLWHSTKFMEYKWFIMDRIMMKYFDKYGTFKKIF